MKRFTLLDVVVAVAVIVFFFIVGFVVVGMVSPVQAADPPGCVRYEPNPPNEPTGIKGCEVWGEGIASHYGPGSGVARNDCTWARRTNSGCGSVTITSLETGLSVTAPVIDYCDCYTGTADERIVDLQWGVVDALGLDRSAGLYRVRVERAGTSSATPAPAMLPNSAMQP